MKPIAQPGMQAKPADAEVAAKQLEAFFLRRLLSEARPASSIDGGFAGETFAEMLNEAIADKMAGAGGVGMAGMFATQLAGTAPTETPAAIAPLELGPQTGEAGPRFALPVLGRQSSGYGMRTHPVKGTEHLHAGLDLAAPTGAPVSAAAGGTVVHAGPAGTYGNLVTVRHESGYETRYAHLSEVSVVKGAKVEAGQQVGRVGSTGLSTGPHLHFEVRENGATVDPAPLLPLHRSTNRTNR